MKPPISVRGFLSWKSWWQLSEAVRSPPVWCLQAQSQLKAIYKDNADTIIGNMDTSIFLGGKEPTTLKELAAAGQGNHRHLLTLERELWLEP